MLTQQTAAASIQTANGVGTTHKATTLLLSNLQGLGQAAQPAGSGVCLDCV